MFFARNTVVDTLKQTKRYTPMMMMMALIKSTNASEYLAGTSTADTMYGGDGADEFSLSFGVENYDIITDFSSLDKITFNIGGASYSSIDTTLNFNTTIGFLGIDFYNDGIVNLGVTLQNYTGSTNFVIADNAFGNGAFITAI
jgi:hypothetical protein